MPFSVFSILFGILFAVWGYTICAGLRRWPDMPSRLPRNPVLGEAIGIVCLIWAAIHVSGMLEGDLGKYRIVVKALVPTIAILSYKHLDFLFARSAGGFLLLGVNALIHGAFARHVPARQLYSSLCYLVGIVGLILIAAPWKMRDFLERCRDSTRWRRCAVGCSIVLALAFIGFGLTAL